MASSKDFIVFSLLFLLICPFIAAAEAQTEKNWLTVEPMKSTPFSFELKNSNPNATTYSLFLKGTFEWLIFPNSQISLSPGETENFTLIGSPDFTVAPQLYPAKLMAWSELDNVEYDLILDVPALNKPQEPKYNIRLVTFDENGFKFLAYSQEPLNLTVEIETENLQKEHQPYAGFSAILDAGEATLERKINFEPGPNSEPVNYTANITVLLGGKIIYHDEKSYEKKFESRLKVSESTQDSFLWSVTTVTIANSGNEAEYKSYDLEAEAFAEMFLSSSESFARIPQESGSIINRWEFLVAGNSARTFTYAYNYSYAFMIILIAILGIAAVIIVLRKGVVLKKTVLGSVKRIKTDNEIRIGIEIANRTGRTVEDVTLEDYIQPLFKIKKSFLGMAPSGFYRKGDDIKIVWKIPKIEPKETRVFTYTIVPKVGLGGSYSFSNAKLTYKIGNFRKIVLSNHARLGK
jgi:hypothetical protein